MAAAPEFTLRGLWVTKEKEFEDYPEAAACIADILFVC